MFSLLRGMGIELEWNDKHDPMQPMPTKLPKL